MECRLCLNQTIMLTGKSNKLCERLSSKQFWNSEAVNGVMQRELLFTITFSKKFSTVYRENAIVPQLTAQLNSWIEFNEKFLLAPGPFKNITINKRTSEIFTFSDQTLEPICSLEDASG